MKRFITVLSLLCVLFITALPTFAGGDLPRLVDGADILDGAEEIALLDMLNEISERQQVDVIVFTVDSIGSDSAQYYADNEIFEAYNYGYGNDRNTILLMLSMEYSDWHVTTAGYGITAVTDAGLEYMSEQFLPYFSDGDFYTGFAVYAEYCDEFITLAKNGDPFDVDNIPKEPFDKGMALIISLAIGLIVAFIAVGNMKSAMKSVREQAGAKDYVKQNSMNITEARDYYLYRNVTRSAKPDNSSSGGSSTHTTSSGTTVGGGGGKF